MTSPLAILAAIAALAAQVAAILKPNTMQSPEEEGAAQPALIAASGRETKALRRTCSPAYDSLQPTATEATGPALLLDQAVPLGGRPRVRACSDTKALVSDMKALVLPKYKLAFCYIPKVACSQFKDLFNHVNGFGNSTLGYGHDYYHSTYWMKGLKMSDITRAKGWKFAAFTRDPALRYLSAFGDVCPMENNVDNPRHMLSCCGPLTSLANSSDAELVQDFKARVKLDMTIGRPDLDQHWASQVDVLESCGWESFRPDNLDYWGVLSGDVNAQVKEMLQVAGHDNPKVADRFFPPDSVAGRTSRLKGEPLDYIGDMETLEGLVQLYADDYRHLPGVGCAFTEPLLAKLKATNASSH